MGCCFSSGEPTEVGPAFDPVIGLSSKNKAPTVTVQGSTISGSGSVLAEMPVLQDKAYFETTVVTPGSFAIGFATKDSPLDGVLSPLDTGETLRQTLVDPTTGDLTVEDDRPVIECLNVVAYSMRAKLHMGNTAAMIMRTRMEKTLDLAADGDGGAGSEIAGTHGVTAAA